MTAMPLTDKSQSWVPGYLALAVIWGASFLFIKVAIGELHPIYVTLGRAGFGAATLLVIVLVTRTRLPRDATWGHLTVVALLGVVVPFTLFGYGEQRITSVLAGIWNATTPLIVLPVAVLLFRTERPTLRRGVGFLLGFLGVLVILGVWHGAGGTDVVGQLMCFGAAICYGFGIPYQRRFLASRGYSGVTLAAGQLIVATLILAAAAPILAGAPPAPSALSLGVIASVFALGAFGTGIAFALNFRVIRVAGATTSASVTYLIPLVSTVIGIAVLGESLTWNQPVGALIVLLGVAISQGLRVPRPTRAVAEVATS